MWYTAECYDCAQSTVRIRDEYWCDCGESYKMTYYIKVHIMQYIYNGRKGVGAPAKKMFLNIKASIYLGKMECVKRKREK